MAILLGVAIGAFVLSLYLASLYAKYDFQSALLLKNLLRNYHDEIQKELEEEKTAFLWSDLTKEYFNKRGWSESHVKEMQEIMVKSHEDFFAREDMILTARESAKEFLRRLLLCEKTFNQNAPLQLEETERIYRQVENLVRKVF